MSLAGSVAISGGLFGLSTSPAGSASSEVPAAVPSLEKKASLPALSRPAKTTWPPFAASADVIDCRPGTGTCLVPPGVPSLMKRGEPDTSGSSKKKLPPTTAIEPLVSPLLRGSVPATVPSVANSP